MRFSFATFIVTGALLGAVVLKNTNLETNINVNPTMPKILSNKNGEDATVTKIAAGIKNNRNLQGSFIPSYFLWNKFEILNNVIYSPFSIVQTEFKSACLSAISLSACCFSLFMFKSDASSIESDAMSNLVWNLKNLASINSFI